MLLRATFKNILSFHEEVQISFVAGKSSTLPEHVCRAEKRDDISVLKSGIIYGANASGKSNVIHCINTLQSFARDVLPKHHVAPFKLVSPNTESSKIEVEFKHAATYYAYGIEFDVHGLREEWLYEIGSRKENKIFTRIVSANGNSFDFGTVSGDSKTHQLLTFIAHGTPANKSFLSEYIKRNGVGLDQVREAMNWFRRLNIIFPGTKYRSIAVDAEKDAAFRTATRELLQFFNTGIVDIRRVKVAREEIGISQEIVENLIENAIPGYSCIISDASANTMFTIDFNNDGTMTFYKHVTVHRADDGTEVIFELAEESDGSIRLLDFIPMLIDLRINDPIYLIDEIDRSMHPMLSAKILEFYNSHILCDLDDAEYMPHESQLIFTTHESNLLDLKQIRADEVWFVEKDVNGASHLTSLSEYKPREDVRKGYLLGRYGAIPFFAPIKKLNWR